MTDEMRDLLARVENAYRFCLNATCSLYQPDKTVHRGLDPTFYHTLTYEGDIRLIEETKKARLVFTELQRKLHR